MAETVALSARLRGVGIKRVRAVLLELGLEDVADTRIGDPLATRASQRGVSGGERKRVALALELLHAPPLLVVDEPTSGLDSRAAVGVMRMLAQLATKQAVVCSVHQPSARALALVAHIGLLSPGGQTLYFGPADEAPAHFKSSGYPLPPLTNAAEHYLEIVADADDDDAQQALLQAYTVGLERRARGGTDVTAALLKLEPSAAAAAAARPAGVGFVTELRALYWRAHTNNMRNPAFLRAMVSRSVTMALVIGYLYSGLGGDQGLSQRSVQDRSGALYFVLTNQIMSSSASLRAFLAERTVIEHERRANLYSLRAYFLARSAAEGLCQLTGALLFGLLAYWLVGLAPTPVQLGLFLVVISLVTLVAESYVVLVGAAMPDERSAAVVSPVVLALLMVCGGLFVNAASLPPLFVLLNKVNVFTHGFSALMRNEMAGLALHCEPSELVGLPPPANLVQKLASLGVAWPEQRCPIEKGEQVLEQMALSASISSSVAALLLLLLAYRLLAYIALSRRLRSPLKR